jgi:uncharacterized membrane-anchored protein
MKIIIWIAFAIVVAAQWYVPVTLVTKSEETLTDGEEFKFKTQPVDPTDPFRGKYITLSFEAETVVVRDTVHHLYENGEVVFAAIGLDSAGYAVVDSLFLENPGPVMPWVIKTRVSYAYPSLDDNSQSVQVNFPFERFYLEESKASEAERVYWQNNVTMNDSTTTSNTYALVRLRDGHAVLVDVMVNDKSIVDVVREMNED